MVPSLLSYACKITSWLRFGDDDDALAVTRTKPRGIIRTRATVGSRQQTSTAFLYLS